MNTSLGVVAEMLYCNSASDRNASKVPLQASAGMKWFRSKVRFGSRLALFALAMQFLLSFGHFHGGAQAASASMDAKRSGFFAVAHLHALDRVSHAIASGAVPLKASRDVPPGQPDEDCVICAVMALASSLVDATPPCLPAPQAVEFLYLAAADAAFVDLQAARGAFQPRAPPIG